MRDSYSYADILFGLYKEYVMIQEQLNLLSKYILLDENDKSCVKFSLTRDLNSDKVRVLCTLYDKLGLLDRIIIRLINDVGTYYFRNSISYVNEDDGIYNIVNFPNILDETKKMEFSQCLNNILNTEFGKNIKMIHYGIGYDNNPFLSVSSDGIHAYLNQEFKLYFDSSRDLFLHVNSYNGKLTSERMENLLNLRFPNTRFPKYYRQLIEECDTFGMDVSIYGEFGYSKKGKFEVVPESKRLVLIRK